MFSTLIIPAEIHSLNIPRYYSLIPKSCILITAAHRLYRLALFWQRCYLCTISHFFNSRYYSAMACQTTMVLFRLTVAYVPARSRSAPHNCWQMSNLVVAKFYFLRFLLSVLCAVFLHAHFPLPFCGRPRTMLSGSVGIVI